MKKKETITQVLKRTIGESGRTQRDIAAKAGISHIVLNRFLNQAGGLSMAGIDNLAEELGLHLVPKPATTKPTIRRKAQ